MSELFWRTARIQVDTLLVRSEGRGPSQRREGLRITFKVEKKADGNPNTC